jgi:hypothetical protein
VFNLATMKNATVAKLVQSEMGPNVILLREKQQHVCESRKER